METPGVSPSRVVQDVVSIDGATAIVAGRDVTITSHGAPQAFLTPLSPPIGRGVHEPTVRGRDALLRELRRLVVDAPTRPRVHVLVGMGGCGKTTVARELARHVQQSGGQAWWINASTAEFVAEGMRALAVALGVDPHILAHASLPDLVWQQMARRTTPWLLVLDNADDPDTVLGPPLGNLVDANGWLRPPAANGLVVITSRDSTPATWAADWIATHPVTTLLSDDGAQLLTEIAGSVAGTMDEARVLSRRLGGLPLALRSAGAYLRVTAEIPAKLAEPGTIRTFADYTIALDSDTASLVSTDGQQPLSADQALSLVDYTWERSIDLLASRGMPQARSLLRLLACFAEMPIPYEMIARRDILDNSASFAGLGVNQVWRLLRGLGALGLVEINEPDDPQLAHPVDWTVALHPLVRDANRTHTDVVDHPMELPFLAVRLVEGLAYADETGLPDDPKGWPWWRAIIPHASHLLVQHGAHSDPEVISAVCRAVNLASRALRAQGRYGQAAAQLEAVLEIQRHVLGEDNLDTLLTRNNLALAWSHLGEYDRAADELEAVLEIQRHVLGEDKHHTLLTRNNLAVVWHDEGEYAWAADEYQAVLDIRRRVFGEDDAATLITRANLALLWADVGEYARAADELEAVLDIRLQILGENHYLTLDNRINLAGLWSDMGEYARAVGEYEAVLDVQRQMLGEDHPCTVDTRNALEVTHLIWDDHS